MLFSNNQIAQYINTNFEPAWQSVRPVPIVNIDFGNGQVLTRTLHGNIATYLCNGQGQVLDILPGIYQPEAYLDRLGQFKYLAKYAVNAEHSGRMEMQLAQYHKSQADALAKNVEPDRFIPVDMSKSGIEGSTKLLLSPRSFSFGARKKSAMTVDLDSPAELANWKELVEDTRINETERRGQIHKLLASGKMTTPKAMTKWLYREVLHADLDDPYLGLGPTLFGSYPFKDRVSMKP